MVEEVDGATVLVAFLYQLLKLLLGLIQSRVEVLGLGLLFLLHAVHLCHLVVVNQQQLVQLPDFLNELLFTFVRAAQCRVQLLIFLLELLQLRITHNRLQNFMKVALDRCKRCVIYRHLDILFWIVGLICHNSGVKNFAEILKFDTNKK